MDQVIKAYFDLYRRQNRLPPEMEGKLPGRLLPDQELLNRWRRWTGPSSAVGGKTTGGLWYRNKNLGADLVGLLDDCLVDSASGGEIYIPLDYKTRGYPPKENTSGYYQTQLDLYTLLLAENGHKTDKIAYLVYYWPLTIPMTATAAYSIATQSSRLAMPAEGTVKGWPREVTGVGQVLFAVEAQRIPTDPSRGLKIFESAARLLQQEDSPSRLPDCSFCQWSDLSAEQAGQSR